MSRSGSSVNEGSKASNPPSDSHAWQGDREIEIKFKTDAAGMKHAAASRLLGAAGEAQVQNLRTIYFDTPSNDLRKHGIVLRIRKKGRAAPVLGFKSSAGKGGSPFARKEVEVRSRELRPNMALFENGTADELVAIVADRPLEQKFEMRVKRRIASVESGPSSIEVALDVGHIIAGKQRVLLREVELELKSGNEADLHDFAMQLSAELPLRLDFVAKSEKGFHAITREYLAPVKATAIKLDPKAMLDDMVVAVISSTLAHFVANWALLRANDSPESIHQMRVALRRMRSAFMMFKWAVPCPDIDVLRSEAKAIASAMGTARNCDAFRMAAEQGPLLHTDRPKGCDALFAALEKRRAVAYKDVRAMIESTGATLFVLKLQSFLVRRSWRNVATNADLPQAQPTAKEFAKATLDKLNGRVLKRGKGLSDLSDTQRHELRIALKNLRYGMDFCGELFGRHRPEPSYFKKISVLQDLLGAHNDVVSAKSLLDQLLTGLGPDAEKAAGFILGWYAREAVIADKKISKAWKKFKGTETFWT